ncbi:hypothetical protein DAI22_09g120600 [Oryza sativa Japonica Group]|nr:hypothetical protein DAI22_09g120600 [Oryza sativa Japonica Group]
MALLLSNTVHSTTKDSSHTMFSVDSEGCVFTYDVVEAYEWTGYRAFREHMNLFYDACSGQFKSPSALLLLAQAITTNFSYCMIC